MLTNSASSVVKHKTGFSVQDQVFSEVRLHISNIKIRPLVNSMGEGRGAHYNSCSFEKTAWTLTL